MIATDRRTDSSEAAPAVARRGRRGAAVAGPVRRAGRRARIQGLSLGMMGSFGAALAVVLWWVFFSRARWSERLGAIVLMIVALVATWRLPARVDGAG